MVNDAAQLQPVEMRSEQERRAQVESEMEQQTQIRLRESKDALLSSLASISLTELRKLNDDDEYRRDSLLTSHASIKLLKQKESLEDQALRTANENIKLAEQLESDAQVYAETVHPRFEELREKVGPLAERLEQRQSELSREHVVKVLKTLANEKYKMGKNAQSSWCKSGVLSKEQFLNEFLKSRTEYYCLNSYIEVLKQA